MLVLPLQRPAPLGVSALVRDAHGASQSPSWDYVTPSGEGGRWCRTGSDYNDWSFNVI